MNSSGYYFFNCMIKRYVFEFFILLCLFFYTVFYLTPSSYGYVLSMLGMESEGLFWGKPREIRSDEWSVWTPYLQALVANDFERFNKFSIYHEDFRNFNALPIFDWGLIFKPQFWSFLVMEPARAFSFHHGLLIAVFLTGWKCFIEKLFEKHSHTNALIFIFFSFILFFSSFVQTWWTTIGPSMAFFPWLMLALFCWQKNSLLYYFFLFYISTVWLLSHTYPPLIITCAYFGFFLLLIYQPGIFTHRKRLILTILSFLLAIAVCLTYFGEVIRTMMNTVFPGQRVSAGGVVPWWHVILSPFFPYLNYSYDVSLLKIINVCEASSVSSLLLLLALCFADYNKLNDRLKRELLFLFFAALFFATWMIIPIPSEWSKYLFLTSVPANRMQFVYGLTINLMALSLLLGCELKFTWKRLILFSGILILFWAIPGDLVSSKWFTEAEWFNKSAMELVAIPLLISGLVLTRYVLIKKQSIVLLMLFIAMLGNSLYFANYNPAQSAQSIFEANKSPQLNSLRLQQQQDSRGWLVSSVDRGAVLNGLGFRSFTHALVQPQLAFFRKLFPELPEQEFNQLFNRYAHIYLYDGDKIDTPYADQIRIPLQWVAE